MQAICAVVKCFVGGRYDKTTLKCERIPGPALDIPGPGPGNERKFYISHIFIVSLLVRWPATRKITIHEFFSFGICSFGCVSFPEDIGPILRGRPLMMGGGGKFKNEFIFSL